MRLKRLILASSAAFFALSSAALANKPTDGGMWLQESATHVMDELTWLHNFVFVIITIITLFVMVLMGWIMFRYSAKRNPVPSKTTHHVWLEVGWTIVPIIILLIMVVPSMRLLYLQDALPETEMTIKVTGNTWNWEYAYPDHPNIESYISNPLEKDEADAKGVPYLLAADVPLVVPVDTKIKELCGTFHYKMPIEVEVVSKAQFAAWVANDGAFTKSVASLSGGSATAAQE